MIKHIVRIACLGWLFWLYFNTPLFTRAKSSAAQTESFQAVQEPLRVVVQSVAEPIGLVTSVIKHDLEPMDNAARLEVQLGRRQVILYRGSTEVRRYPIAIGQRGWETPKGQFRVLDMRRDPNWIHPLTGKFVPNGHPENPLGRHWIGFWTDGQNWVGFHGTPKANTVGRAASHGCLRMYDQDVDELYYQVSTGTPVTVKP